MNLALGAVFLAILLIPPLILLYFFGKGTHAKQIPKLTLIEYLLLSAILSLLLHSSIIHILKLHVDYKFLVQFVSGQFKPEDVEQYKSKYETYFTDFARYVFLVCLSCLSIGTLLRIIVTSRRLRMIRWLQKRRNNRKPNDLYCYFNSWWYYFRENEYSSKYDFLGHEEPLVYVDALVDTKDTTLLYCGVLLDFVIKGDELAFIYLQSTTKRLFTEKDTSQSIKLKDGEEVKIVPSGLMCIPYSKIINIHIRFVSEPKMLKTSERGIEEELEIIKNAIPIES